MDGSGPQVLQALPLQAPGLRLLPDPPLEAGVADSESPAEYLQGGRRYANRTKELPLHFWPQGAHIPVLTARFPLQGAADACGRRAGLSPRARSWLAVPAYWLLLRAPPPSFLFLSSPLPPNTFTPGHSFLHSGRKCP